MNKKSGPEPAFDVVAGAAHQALVDFTLPSSRVFHSE